VPRRYQPLGEPRFDPLRAAIGLDTHQNGPDSVQKNRQLDVSFGEDAARNRKDNRPANIAVIRRRALDVVRLDQSKGSQS